MSVLGTYAKRQVSPIVFKALQNLDSDQLALCNEEQLRPILPCLSRMSLINPLDESAECASRRRIIFGKLAAIELVNSIVGLLSIDFHTLEVDVKKEQQLR